MKSSLILALTLGVALTPAAALAERGSTDTFVPQFTEMS
jgi:hypothetical protein